MPKPQKFAIMESAKYKFMQTGKGRLKQKTSRILMVFFILFSLFPGWPINYKPVNDYIPKAEEARAADFQIKTGYYVGSGSATTTISDVGFQADLIIVKSDKSGDTNGGMFYSSSMTAPNGAYLGAAAANSSTSFVAISSSGFSVGPNNPSVNQSLGLYQYIAIRGTNSNFKVGTYIGNGSDNRSISDVGFQPDLVITKADAATAAVWRSSAMTGDVSLYFTATASSTDLIQSLDAGGFTLGANAAVNASDVTFYYIAMKADASTMKVGNYTGNGSDNRSLTGVGFKPNFLVVKHNGATAGAIKSDQYQGESSNTFITGGIGTNKIQALEADGFQVGTDAQVNSNNVRYDYFAFGGYAAPAASGEYAFKTGYYIGSGVASSVTGLGFQPELVVVKGENTGYMVFKTSLVNGGYTLTTESVNLTTGIITSLDSDGFSIGTDSEVNTAGDLYQWFAFDGVNNSDFKIGAYTGNGIDDTNIAGIGFQPDMVWIKAAAVQAAVWRSSATSSDWTNYFRNLNGVTNMIQSFGSDGFQVGTHAAVNGSGSLNFYVAFKSSAAKLFVGMYTGDGSDDRNITGVGFTPDVVITKAINSGTARSAVFRIKYHNGDSSIRVHGDNNGTNKIQQFSSNGFQVGNDVLVNENAAVYHYFAFSGDSVISKTGNYYMETGSYTGNGTARSITGVGFKPDLVVIKDTAANGAIYKNSLMVGDSSTGLGVSMSISSGVITSLDSDGFSLGTAASVNNTGNTYYWYAFGNAGCSNFKLGAYAGTGADNREITGIGFSPDLVEISASSLGAWRQSSYVGDSSLRFYNVASSSDQIQALSTDGFQVGTSNVVNAAGTSYSYFAFDSSPGYFSVGKYVGNASDNRSVTSTGFLPDLVWIKSAANTVAAQRTSKMTGDTATFFTATANSANVIQAFENDGFQIGTDASINTNNINYYWAAWKQIPPDLQMIRYRWRNDDGNEANASFAAAEDTAILNVEKNSLKRLRIEISNEGYSSDSSAYTLEYGKKETTCAAISSWAAVSSTADWKMVDSSNITNAETTTNVSGGLTDENTTFVFGQAMDSDSTTGGLTVRPGEFTELEYSIAPSDSATGGANYCFRVTRSGNTTNFNYVTYPEASVKSGAVAVSITTDGVVSFGALDFNTTTSTDSSSAETVSVDSGPANLSIRSTDFTSGTSTWMLGTTNGFDQVKFEYATSTNPTWTTFSTSGTLYVVDNNVSQGTTRDIRFQITMPTSSLNYTQFSSNVTVVATAP